MKTENLLRDKEETANLVNGLEFEKEAALNKIKTLQASREIGDERISSYIEVMEDVKKRNTELCDELESSTVSLSNIKVKRNDLIILRL